MKSLGLALVFLVGIGFSAQAQPEKDFEDLLVLLIDGKYKKCVGKAMGYTENDNTKKHPLPYLYVGMAYFEMSKLEEYAIDYPKALKDAAKYTIKFRKKDKELAYWDEYQNFISELKIVLIEECENWFDAGKPKKAHYNYRQMTTFDPGDQSAWFMKGYCELLLAMPTEAVKSFAMSKEKLDAVSEFKSLPTEQRDLLKFGLMRYSDYLVEQGQADSAKATLAIGYPYFDRDEAYKAKYTALEY